LFAKYGSKSTANSTSSCLLQIENYLDMQDIDDESLAFWQHSQTQALLNKLYLLHLHHQVCLRRVQQLRGCSVTGDHHAAATGPT